MAHVDSPYDEILVEIAALLRQFDDPKSIAVLKILEHIGTQENSVRCIAQTARESLQWMAAAPDLVKFKPGMPPRELEALILKYRLNDVARADILSAIKKEYEKDPARYVPLFVEYYANETLAIEIAKKYPDIADRGLEKCLAGTNADIVGYCMILIGELGKDNYLPRINSIAFYKEGNVDYKNADESYRVRDRALTAYYYLGAKSIPYLEKILYSQYEGNKSSVIGRLESFGTREALGILKKYLHFSASLSSRNQPLLDELSGAILRVEEKIK